MPLRLPIYVLCVWAVMLYPLSASAQLTDSIRASFQHKPSPYFNYGSQYSFISNQFAGISYVKLGVDYGGITRFGVGYNWLNRKFPERVILHEGKPVEANLFVRYFSFFAEYTYFRTYRWEASIPAQIGLGVAGHAYSPNGHRQVLGSRFFVLYEPIMTIQYRFFRYFAAGGGVGYRIMLTNRSALDEKFTSPLLVLKTRFYFGDLWTDVKARIQK